MDEEQASRRGFWHWLDVRLGIDALRYPAKEHGNTIYYSIGGMTLMTFLLLIATGLILAQWYNPSPDEAYKSVQFIMAGAPGGGIVRGLHFWLAHAAALLVILHLIRVFVTGSFKRMREMNWELGVILFGIMTFFFYTGTVIKWDQEGIEALGHTQEIGELLGPVGTLLTGEFTQSVSLLGRMYLVHVSLLPILFLAVVIIHLLLIKHLGISPWPFGTLDEIRRRTENEPTKPFTTHVVRLLVYGLVILLIALVLAAAFPPPLGPAPKEGIEITKPPWPFLWLLPLEKYFAVKAILIAFGVLFLGLAAWPFVERTPELDPRRRPLAMVALGLALAVFAGLTIWGALIPPGHVGG